MHSNIIILHQITKSLSIVNITLTITLSYPCYGQFVIDWTFPQVLTFPVLILSFPHCSQCLHLLTLQLECYERGHQFFRSPCLFCFSRCFSRNHWVPYYPLIFGRFDQVLLVFLSLASPKSSYQTHSLQVSHLPSSIFLVPSVPSSHPGLHPSCWRLHLSLCRDPIRNWFLAIYQLALVSQNHLIFVNRSLFVKATDLWVVALSP